MVTAEMKGVCAIRSMYALPCEKCRYNDRCSTYKNQNENLKTKMKKKEGKENEQKKQRKRSRKQNSDI